MKKLIEMKTVVKDGHHMVTYDGKGHKKMKYPMMV